MPHTPVVPAAIMRTTVSNSQRRRLVPVVFLAVLAAAKLAVGQSEGMAWRTDLQAALQEAKQSDKLVLAHFWTTTCGPCRSLDARVFSQPSVAVAVSEAYVPVKINAEESPELARAFGVTRVPTDAVVTPEGKLVKAFISPPNPMEYVGYVTKLAAAYKTRAGATFAAAAAAAPAQPFANERSAVPPAINAAYAGLTAAPPQAPAAQPQPQVIAGIPSQPPTQPAAPAPQVKPEPVTPEPVSTASVPTTPPAITPVTPAAPPTQVADTGLQLPPGSPPLGFEGFCPVTMKNDWRWAKGDVRFGAIHRGRTYLFASQDAQQKFLASPEAFSPILAGADPVLAVDERRNVPGVRDYAVEYQGRFFMFSSEQTLERFWSKPEDYAQAAERVAALPANGTIVR